MKREHYLILLIVFAAALLLSVDSTVATPLSEPNSAAFEEQITDAKSSMMAQPAKALASARAARTIATDWTKDQSAGLQIETADWLIGEALTRLKHPEQALPLLQKTAVDVSQVAPGSKLLGDVLKSRGRAEEALGKIQDSLEDFQAAYKIYERCNQPRFQAIALQQIGSIYADARDYPRVLQYYAQSRDIFAGDPALTLAAANNLGFALKEMGRLSEAETEFRKALAVAGQLNSNNLLAHIYTNIAAAEAMAGKDADARADVMRGLAIAERDTEAKDEIPFLRGVLAKIAEESGDTNTAAHLVDQVFAGVDLNHTSTEYRDFHEIAERIYEKTGDQENALAHLKAFKRLDDEGRALAASTNAALMSAKFDFTNQNLRISRLKEGQLERDVKLAQSKSRLQTVILSTVITGGIGVLIITLFGLVAMRRSRDRISAANGQLSMSNMALEKALKAKTEFLATTSHEIRTPLNGILGMAQVILSDQSVETSVRERVQLVRRAGETMKLLVDDMLDLAKIETGVITIEEAPFNLREILTDAAKFWEDPAASKGLELRFDATKSPEGNFIGDEFRLRQVIYNLLSNAVKFTEAGEILLSAGSVEHGIFIEVKDTGIGIDSSQKERIFDAFTQVDSSTSRKYGGAGLGLSICKNVCEAMQGSIAVQSTLGEGSRFVVTLPLRAQSAIASDAEADINPELSTANVLLLDANPLSQSVLKTIITPVVRQLDVTNNAQDALHHCGKTAVDVLIISALPAAIENGDFAETLRSFRVVRTNLKVVVLLSAGQNQYRAKLLNEGVNAVLLRPIAPADLLVRLTNLFIVSDEQRLFSEAS